MTFFVLRPTSPGDLWERFVHGCFEEHVLALLGDRQVLHYSSLLSEDHHRTRFREALGGAEEGVLLALCHGTDYGALYVSGGDVVAAEHVGYLRGKFCYLVACYSGEVLGPSALQSGAKGFVGFKGKIKTTRVLPPDDLAIPWRRALMSGLLVLLQSDLTASAATVAGELRRALEEFEMALDAIMDEQEEANFIISAVANEVRHMQRRLVSQP